MGKYMRKGKVADEVAVMEVAAAPLGVRTRARALALQRLPQGEGGGAGGEYLELRSRRLEKLPPRAVRRKAAAVAAAEAVAAATAEQADAEVSLGENVLESEAMERSTRETTPCSLIRESETISTPGSLIRDSETISTPGSTTRPNHCRVQTPVRHIIPNSSELDEFFTAAEQLEQQAFVDKYNFDPVNDCPLPGRYEWVKLD